VKKQVEVDRVKLEAFEATFPRPVDLGQVTSECWGPIGPRTSFEETLVRFGTLLDFDRLVQYGAPRQR
jgi:hypothetical protein